MVEIKVHTVPDAACGNERIHNEKDRVQNVINVLIPSHNGVYAYISTMDKIKKWRLRKKNIELTDRLTAKKAATKEEDLELQKSMLNISYNTEDEEELKKLLNSLAPYLKNKMRPILFITREKDTIRTETHSTIDKLLSELKTTPKSTKKTSEVFVNGDTMQIDETNVTINIDDDPFTNLDQTDTTLNKMKLLEEEKR